MLEAAAIGKFSEYLIAWQRKHGRHDLPWQNVRDPYAVWVAEIMLQQTQVSTVIPYYQRFVSRFPDISSLAKSDQDTVLQHWSGLGYYSRARNLHAAAQVMNTDHEGKFPQNFGMILALPGVGRSTASAICVFAYGQRFAILDGNVKRVLTRFFGIDGWTGQISVEKKLWDIAEKLLPENNIEVYTQSLMDLGSIICKRSHPKCVSCPVSSQCVALNTRRITELPTTKPRKPLPERKTVMLLLQWNDEVLLEKRPPTGIWGGMWSFPEVSCSTNLEQYCHDRFGVEIDLLPPLNQITHKFTHFSLHILPQPLEVAGIRPLLQQAETKWLKRDDAINIALPAPIKVLMKSLK